MFKDIFELEMIMVLLIAVGIYLRAKGRFSPESQSFLTDLLIDIIIPCSIIMSFIGQGNFETLRASLPIVGLSVINMLMCAALGKICFRSMPSDRSTPARYGMINSNSMFIGLPVILSLLGTEGALLQSLYMIFVRSFIWSYGLGIYAGRGMGFKSTVHKVLTHPCMISSVIGALIMFFGIPLPEVLSRTIGYFSSCLMALSMILIGGILYGLNIRHAFRKDVWWFCVVRLLITPAAALGICLLLGTEYMITSVVVVMNAMPAASMTAVLGARYDCDHEYASLIVAVSTTLSIIGIPMWFLIVRAVFQQIV